MNNEDIQKEIEDNFIKLCVTATRASSGRLVSENSYSYTKNCLMEWYDKIFHIKYLALESPTFFRDIKFRILNNEIPNSIFLSSELVSRGIDKQFLNNGFEQFYEQIGMAIRTNEKKLTLQHDEDIRLIKTKEQFDEWIDCLELVFRRKRNKILYKKNYDI